MPGITVLTLLKKPLACATWYELEKMKIRNSVLSIFAALGLPAMVLAADPYSTSFADEDHYHEFTNEYGFDPMSNSMGKPQRKNKFVDPTCAAPIGSHKCSGGGSGPFGIPRLAGGGGTRTDMPEDAENFQGNGRKPFSSSTGPGVFDQAAENSNSDDTDENQNEEENNTDDTDNNENDEDNNSGDTDNGKEDAPPNQSYDLSGSELEEGHTVIDVRRVGTPNGGTLDRSAPVKRGTYPKTGIDQFTSPFKIQDEDPSETNQSPQG